MPLILFCLCQCFTVLAGAQPCHCWSLIQLNGKFSIAQFCSLSMMKKHRWGPRTTMKPGWSGQRHCLVALGNRVLQWRLTWVWHYCQILSALHEEAQGCPETRVNRGLLIKNEFLCHSTVTKDIFDVVTWMWVRHLYLGHVRVTLGANTTYWAAKRTLLSELYPLTYLVINAVDPLYDTLSDSSNASDHAGATLLMLVTNHLSIVVPIMMRKAMRDFT